MANIAKDIRKFFSNVLIYDTTDKLINRCITTNLYNTYLHNGTNQPDYGEEYLLCFRLKGEMYLPLYESLYWTTEEIPVTSEETYLGYRMVLNKSNLCRIKYDKEKDYGYKTLTPFLNRIGDLIDSKPYKSRGVIPENVRFESSGKFLSNYSISLLERRSSIARDKDNNLYYINRYGIFEADTLIPLVMPTVRKVIREESEERLNVTLSSTSNTNRMLNIYILVNPLLFNNKKPGYKEIRDYIEGAEGHNDKEAFFIKFMDDSFINSIKLVTKNEYIDTIGFFQEKEDAIKGLKAIW